MKTGFFSLLRTSVLSLLLFVLVAAPLAQAQVTPTDAQIQQNALITAQNTITSGSSGVAAQQGQNVGVDNNANIGCNISTAASNFGGTFALCLTNIIYVFTVGIGSGFAYVSAYFFDWAVALSLNGSAYALDFVSTGWATARDLANMTFLFILLYIAFKIMFEADTGSTSKMLVTTIMIALLVNFSFFFTRLAIDAGNILAIQFYNAIDAPPVGASPAAAATAVNTAASYVGGTSSFSNSKDLTASIMGMLQLQNLFSTNSFQQFFNGKSGAPNTSAGFLVTTIALSFLYIAAAIMFWILTVAFITNGIKFLVRIVVLWFLIIASPLALAAYAVPNFKTYFNQWRDALIKHSFYPVAFMFIFLILTTFTKEMGGQAGLINGIFNGLGAANNSATAVASIGYAVANVGIRMGFVIAMLYLGMEASNKIGVMGAKQADKIGGWVGGKLTGTYRGVGNLAARTAGGIYAGGVGSMAYDTQEQLKGTKFGNSWLGYRIRKNVLNPVAGSSVGGAKSYAEVVKDRGEKAKTQKVETSTNLRKIETQEVIKKTASGSTINDIEKKRIQSLNKTEVEAIKTDDLMKIAHVLTEDQIKKLGDSDKVNEADKEKIKSAWAEKSGDAPLQKAIKNLAESVAGNAAAMAHVANAKSNQSLTIDGAWSAQLKTILQTQHSAATAAWNQPGGKTPANHTAMQHAQEALNKFKDFEDNRKKVDAADSINSNTKGAFKSSLIP